MEIITKSSSETFEVGRKIGANLKGGEVISLVGNLGVGKTTFVQGLAAGLGIKNKIVSPTFILMRTYAGNFKLYHLDLYRLEGDIDSQVRDLGFIDILNNKNNIVVIEWAEKIKNSLPKNTQFIAFENLSENERKITINETLY